jgi:endonuclease/exonuclease/phosphatase family metal-dependent hydrolase
LAPLRIASFNVQNLFTRARALNKDENSETTAILGRVAELQTLLAKAVYAPADKARILELYRGSGGGIALKDYIEVREDRGKLFRKSGNAIVGVQSKTNGRADWDGSIEFKRTKFNELTRKNTAQVLKDLRADILCLVEVEDRPAAVDFDSNLLNGRFPYEIVIDGNDDRGIDVALLSRHPIGSIHTHIFDRGATASSRVFARDCLEVEVMLPGDRRLVMLCNHFTSKLNGGGGDRRRAQADRVRDILSRYDLTRDWVVVAGDFNDTPDSPALSSLMAPNMAHLHDVLALQFPDHPGRRWTYFFDGFDQIDYILVSDALRSKFKSAGVLRKGIPDVEATTSRPSAAAAGVVKETGYPSVTSWTNSASDHGAVWAEFDV